MSALAFLAGWFLAACAAAPLVGRYLHVHAPPPAPQRRSRLDQEYVTHKVEDAANDWVHRHGDRLPEAWLQLEVTDAHPS